MEDNVEQYSGQLNYPFHAIAENSIAVTDLTNFNESIDTNTNIEI
jgi:hypothetical protein